MPIPKHRRTLYGPEWPSISRRIRFERAQGRCEWCGAQNGHPHPETGSRVILTVAHLNHDPTDHREDNLAALCQRCHLHHDRFLHALRARDTRLARKLGGPQQPLFPPEELASLYPTHKMGPGATHSGDTQPQPVT